MPLDAAAIDIVARTCHEINRGYCQTLGDTSQPTWDEAPGWQKDSARNGVRFIMANPGANPSDSHHNWLIQKEAEGWVYGETKDPERKTHPCMVPYADLPADQKFKDTLFQGVVLAALAVAEHTTEKEA